MKPTLTLKQRIELAKERRRKVSLKTTNTLSSEKPSESGEKVLEALKLLPSNYDFQIAKTLKRLKECNAKKVALQLPEGLLIYSCILSDIFTQLCDSVQDVVIFGDVTYGACCVDDFAAKALNCDFMVHYGHSCLVPIDVTKSADFTLMYVFVDIKFNTSHLTRSVSLTFPNPDLTKIHLLGTIQFSSCLSEAKRELEKEGFEVNVPQLHPLSKGEVLGCTSPTLTMTMTMGSSEKKENCECKKEKAFELSTLVQKEDVMVFVADGRFHMESAMIANPSLPSFRFNPYDKKLTRESYDSELMKSNRLIHINAAKKAQKWCVILGTLGRQGNPSIVARIEKVLREYNKEYFVLLLSEAFPDKLKQFEDSVDAFVQVCCPRLSLDWGMSFHKPFLTSYELFVTFDKTKFREVYPQDFYASDSGPWTNYFSQKASGQ